MPERVHHQVHGRNVVSHTDDDILPALAEAEAVTSAQVLVSDADDSLSAVDMTGDLTIDNAGATTIGTGKVLVGMLDATLLGFMLPVGRIDATNIDYCKIG